MRFDFQAYLPEHHDGRPFEAADLLELEREAGVQAFVVMPEPIPRPDNPGLAGRIRDHGGMIGCASVNPRLGKPAMEDLEQALTDLGFRGLKLSPMDHDYALDDPIVDPFVERAGRIGMPVTVDADGERCTPDLVRALASRHPGVTFIADLGFRPHVTPPGTGAILDAAHRCPNLHLGITALTASEPHHLRSIVAALGPDRVVFGSGAPYGIPLFAVGGIRRAGFGQQAEERIFGGNLARIYSIPTR